MWRRSWKTSWNSLGARVEFLRATSLAQVFAVSFWEGMELVCAVESPNHWPFLAFTDCHKKPSKFFSIAIKHFWRSGSSLRKRWLKISTSKWNGTFRWPRQQENHLPEGVQKSFMYQFREAVRKIWSPCYFVEMLPVISVPLIPSTNPKTFVHWADTPTWGLEVHCALTFVRKENVIVNKIPDLLTKRKQKSSRKLDVKTYCVCWIVFPHRNGFLQSLPEKHPFWHVEVATFRLQ